MRNGRAPSDLVGPAYPASTAALDSATLPSDADLGLAEPLFADAPNPGFALAVEDGLNGRKGAGDPTTEKARKGRRRIPPTKAIKAQKRAIVARALASGDSPLEVMLDNMRWAVLKARALEALLDGFETKSSFEDVVRLREMADASAYRAAPYLHARLAPILPKGEKGLVVNLVIEDA